MPSDESVPAWPVRDRFVELRSRWLTVIGEQLQDHQGNVLEYWRVEKVDSLIVLPIQGDRLLLPAPSYRPGVGQGTLDFPGGRVPAEQDLDTVAIAILHRELGVEVHSITDLKPLNATGWPVNSSFSNQKLYGFVAQIDQTLQQSQLVDQTYPITPAGVQELLQKLFCLQCRAVLLEWWLHQSKIFA
ncbi:MAG: NUDIX hydrolase [Leptolyngbyaceae cyanobacterium bins.349]|nr:NUDIX hydrolase [Leptolyngbyaceae cyanobacterium bins.349]